MIVFYPWKSLPTAHIWRGFSLVFEVAYPPIFEINQLSLYFQFFHGTIKIAKTGRIMKAIKNIFKILPVWGKQLSYHTIDLKSGNTVSDNENKDLDLKKIQKQIENKLRAR
jgi:hypothetical protein